MVSKQKQYTASPPAWNDHLYHLDQDIFGVAYRLTNIYNQHNQLLGMTTPHFNAE